MAPDKLSRNNLSSSLRAQRSNPRLCQGEIASAGCRDGASPTHLVAFVCLLLLAVFLAACGSTPEAPTPLPTAVPPAPGRSPGIWTVSFRYEFPTGVFGLGEHRYAFLIHCPMIQSEDITTDWFHFVVSDEVLPQPEPIYLRYEWLLDHTKAQP